MQGMQKNNFTILMSVIFIQLLIIIPNTIFAQNSDALSNESTVESLFDSSVDKALDVSAVYTDFDWDRYFTRLEKKWIGTRDAKLLLNYLGNYFLSTEEVDYSQASDEKKNEIIKAALASSQNNVRNRVLSVAIEYANEESADILLDTLANETNKSVKRGLIHTIGRVGSTDHILPLTQLLRDDNDSDYQVALACALGRLGGTGDQLNPLIFMAENNDDLTIKCAAIMGLGRISDPATRDVLIDFTKHDDLEVRYSSILALTFFDTTTEKDNELKEQLQEQINSDPSFYVKIVIAYHLLKRYGFDSNYSNFLASALNTHPQYQLAVLDFMENLAFPYFINIIERVGYDVRSRYLKATFRKVADQIRTKNSGT